MTCFVGVLLCILVSGCWAPALSYFLNHSQWSKTLPMLCVEYTLFLASLILFIYILEPASDFWNFEKRGSAFYFTSCMLVCVSVNQITLTAVRFELIQSSKQVEFFAEDEPFLKTPFGICSEMWHCIFTFSMSLIMIFVMDNGLSPRNYALYWCGATLTSGMVTGIALVSGTFAKRIKYTSVANTFYFLVALWMLSNLFISQPRNVRCKTSWRRCSCSKVVLVLMNVFVIAFHFFRILSITQWPILDNSQYFRSVNSLIRVYARQYEPYMIHNSRFGLTWIMFVAGYGIPCSFIAIYHLLRQTTLEAANLALMHAGSTLQGTVVYLSYSAFSSSEKRFRIRPKVFSVVLSLNVLIVVTSHIFLLLALFEKPLQKPAKHGKTSPSDVKCLLPDRYRLDWTEESANEVSSSTDSDEDMIVRLLSSRRH